MPCKRCCAACRLRRSQQMLLSLILGAGNHERLMVLGMYERSVTLPENTRSHDNVCHCHSAMSAISFIGLVSSCMKHIAPCGQSGVHTSVVLSITPVCFRVNLLGIAPSLVEALHKYKILLKQF